MYVKWLGEIGKSDVEDVGGKAASLSDLIGAGMPVPEGFVISASVYDMCLSHCLSAEDKYSCMRDCYLPPDVVDEILSAYESLGDVPLAVRSSATAEDMESAAFAGQYDTIVGVRGKEALIDAIRQVMASVWTPRAIDYRQKRNIPHEKVRMAVIVQRLLSADVSGVMFTANPINGRRNEFVIDVVKGLGERLVGGEATPTHYVVSCISYMCRKKEVSIGEDNVILPTSKLMRLVLYGKAIEEHFGRPQDIEWAVERGKIYILQSRPITRIPMAQKDIGFLKRGLLGIIMELMPHRPYPVDLDWMRMVFREGVLKAFASMGVRMPFNMDDVVRSKDGVPIMINPYLLTTSQGIVDFFFSPSLLSIPVKTAKMLSLYDASVWEKDELHTRIWDLYERLKKGCSHSCNRRERLLYVRDVFSISRYAGLLRSRYLASAATSVALVYALLKQMGREDLFHDLVFTCLDTVITQSNREMEHLADMIRDNPYMLSVFQEYEGEALLHRIFADEKMKTFADAFSQFLDKWGSRNVGGVIFLSDGTWKDSPTVPLAIIRDMAIGEVKGQEKDACTRYREALNQVYANPLMQKERMRQIFKKALDRARMFHPIRENTRFYIILGGHLIMDMMRDIGRHLARTHLIDDPDDIKFLRITEVGMDDRKMAEVIRRRKSMWWRLKDVPFIPLSVVHSPVNGDDEDVLVRGIPAGGGKSRGRVCVIMSEEEFHKMEKGCILVAPYTSPSWTPLFALASGVVVDTGGPLSHAAIVAREYGIPAVMGTGNGTKVLRDGMLVEVDGDTGSVKEISS